MKPVDGNAWRRPAGVVVLILLAGLVTTLGPCLRMPNHVQQRLRLNRLVLLSETVNETRVALGLSTRTAAFLVAPVLVGALLVLSRRRRTAFGPVPVRRRKLPAGNSKSADPSD